MASAVRRTTRNQPPAGLAGGMAGMAIQTNGVHQQSANMAAVVNRAPDPEFQRIVMRYVDFLDDANESKKNSERIKEMIEEKSARIVIDLDELKQFDETRLRELLRNATYELTALQTALKNVVKNVDAAYADEKDLFYVGLSGSFGSRHVDPRKINARLLGGIVCIEGIVTKCSLVKPKIVRSVHYCPATEKTIERRYIDASGMTDATSRSAYPVKDETGNPLETEYGLCVYKDHQTFTMQELPEKAPPGQLPRSVDVIVEDDLVDNCKPGDRVLVVGTYKVNAGKVSGFFTGNFRTLVIANFITQQNRDTALVYSDEDQNEIRRFAKQKDIFEVMARSVAPSIYGNEYVKQAILCLLLGGQEKILPNGTRLRGDINILLIGDPSVAKSQMLRFVLQIASIAVATTGRGSSGVGLTAAVTTDESGDRRLEAGAMVLADRGVVCIDEFDKMLEEDRTAIHEVMEQGRVTISKAGIHAKLNARCSVLAAANPVYGRYDPYKSPMDNIGLQDSLLSRFDLIFVMTDKADQEMDLILADHVVRVHRYRAPGELDGEPSRLQSGVEWLSTNVATMREDTVNRSETYEKYDPILHGNRKGRSQEKIICREFLRKYLMIVKNCAPQLTKPACEYIAKEYAQLRSQDQITDSVARTQPVTARALETMIRLATAHAKCRLAKKIEESDAKAACELVQFAYFQKVEKRQRKKRILEDGAEEAMEVDEEGTSDERRNKPRLDDPDDPYRFGSESVHGDESAATAPTTRSRTQSQKSQEISAAKFAVFKEQLNSAFVAAHTETISEAELKDYIAKNSTVVLFTHDEMKAGFDKLTSMNKIMVFDTDEGNQVTLL